MTGLLRQYLTIDGVVVQDQMVMLEEDHLQSISLPLAISSEMVGAQVVIGLAFDPPLSMGHKVSPDPLT